MIALANREISPGEGHEHMMAGVGDGKLQGVFREAGLTPVFQHYIRQLCAPVGTIQFG